MNDADSRQLLSLQELMDYAGTLRQMALSEHNYPRMPEFIARVLNLPSLCLSIFRCDERNAYTTAMFAQYWSSNTRLHFQRQYVPGDLKAWIHLGAGELDQPACSDRSCTCRRVVMRHVAEFSHTLLLIFIEQPPDYVVSAETRSVLELTARYVSTCFKAIFECESRPQILGKRFERLTRTEWRVLRVLDSDHSEKQLAARLDLSIHALHAHIKSIYRKLNVSGRLQAIHLSSEACQRYYIQNMHDAHIRSLIETV